MSKPTSPVRDLLRGYASANPQGIVAMAQLDNWAEIAKAELQTRALQIIQAVDDKTLRAMASGELDFAALCREVASELEHARASQAPRQRG